MISIRMARRAEPSFLYGLVSGFAEAVGEATVAGRGNVC
jgi:hypothetical protein